MPQHEKADDIPAVDLAEATAGVAETPTENGRSVDHLAALAGHVAFRHSLRTTQIAVTVCLGLSGFLFANIVSRLPSIRDRLQLDEARMGYLLLSVAIGSLVTLPLSGWIITTVAPKRVVIIGNLMTTTGLVVACFALQRGPSAVFVIAGCLAAYGSGFALWDVAVNVEAARVEQCLGRPVLTQIHAGFSMGTVAGAAGGAAFTAARLPLELHLVIVLVISVAAQLWCVTRFLPTHVHHRARITDSPGAQSRVWSAWRNPRTLVIGVFALGMAFTEGAATDWLTLGFVDDYQLSHSWAAVGLGIFFAAMTITRLSSPRLLMRYGRVALVRLCVGCVIIGIALFAAAAQFFSGWLAFAVGCVAVMVWGFGVAMGFPVAISAAADEKAAEAHVSVVSSIAYVAFLAGPPAIGAIAHRFGVTRGLLAAIAPAVVALVCSAATAPLASPAASHSARHIGEPKLQGHDQMQLADNVDEPQP